jgi:mono/diheme cytochrome c family protein
MHNAWNTVRTALLLAATVAGVTLAGSTTLAPVPMGGRSAGLQAAEPPPAAADHPGLTVYREHCGRCHGDDGAGTKDVPQPLVGDRSVAQLADYIHDTMPEDDPSLVTGAAARQVAEYIHGAFYSPVARDRNRPARVELSRLTTRQFRNVVADLVGAFRGPAPALDGVRGLRGEYFLGRRHDRSQLVFEQVDPEVDFDFGIEGPDPERFEPNRFAVRWTGSLVPPETGTYEMIVRSAHSVRLSLNGGEDEPPLIDAYVQSGTAAEHRAGIFLLGGRVYPLRLEFSKANQGVDNKRHERLTHASIQLLWKPPHGTVETVPERCLVPHEVPATFVLKAAFPPDDRSTGYERGTSVSKEWFAAATTAGIETAAHVVDHIGQLADLKADAPDRADRLRAFATAFAAAAFRSPLTDDLRRLMVDRPFADAPSPDTGLKRSLLLVLGSPRFLFREAAADVPAAFNTAARLSFGLWDSIPDRPLWEAAAANQLTTAEQVARQAERMVDDRRTRAKIRDFLFSWLRIDHGPEIVKDAVHYSEFSPEMAADMRTSLALFLDDVVWGPESDFRRFFTDDEVYVNGRLAPLYGVSLPVDAPFRRIRLDDGRRAGVISHPYLLSILAYADATSPIHRGVFLARHVLGNVLRPPQEAVAPLAPELHPDLTTRQRVATQTNAVACQTCHTMINPLGFALEEFDTIGRHRRTEQRGGIDRPIDASGSYQPREGTEVTFQGARELATWLATSRDAQEAFVQNLFHALVKQPVRAWGPDTLDRLRRSFAANGFDVRRLLVDIMTVAAVPPSVTATGEMVP